MRRWTERCEWGELWRWRDIARIETEFTIWIARRWAENNNCFWQFSKFCVSSKFAGCNWISQSPHRVLYSTHTTHFATVSANITIVYNIVIVELHCRKLIRCVGIFAAFSLSFDACQCAGIEIIRSNLIAINRPSGHGQRELAYIGWNCHATPTHQPTPHDDWQWSMSLFDAILLARTLHNICRSLHSIATMTIAYRTVGVVCSHMSLTTDLGQQNVWINMKQFRNNFYKWWHV